MLDPDSIQSGPTTLVLAKQGKNGPKFQLTPFLKKSNTAILFAIQNCLIIIDPPKSTHPTVEMPQCRNTGKKLVWHR
jgi:hypothetical protein